jgi:hypothetical protein
MNSAMIPTGQAHPDYSTSYMKILRENSMLLLYCCDPHYDV